MKQRFCENCGVSLPAIATPGRYSNCCSDDCRKVVRNDYRREWQSKYRKARRAYKNVIKEEPASDLK